MSTVIPFLKASTSFLLTGHLTAVGLVLILGIVLTLCTRRIFR